MNLWCLLLNQNQFQTAQQSKRLNYGANHVYNDRSKTHQLKHSLDSKTHCLLIERLTWSFSGVLDPSVRHHSCRGRRPTCGDESWSTSRHVPSCEKPAARADLKARKRSVHRYERHTACERVVNLFRDVNVTTIPHLAGARSSKLAYFPQTSCWTHHWSEQ